MFWKPINFRNNVELEAISMYAFCYPFKKKRKKKKSSKAVSERLTQKPTESDGEKKKSMLWKLYIRH